MYKTLEIEKLDLEKNKAYTSSNNSIKLSPNFELIMNNNLIITTQMNEKEQRTIIKKAIKRRKILLDDLIIEGRKQRKKAYQIIKQLEIKAGNWDGTAEILKWREIR